MPNLNTGLTDEQVLEAFYRALHDMTDSDIEEAISTAVEDKITEEQAASIAEEEATNAVFIWSTEIENGTNLDTLTDAGRYYATVGDAAGIVNMPSTYNGAFELIVEKIDAETVQTMIALNGSRLYVRATESGTFSVWSQYVTSALMWGQGQSIPEGADLNDYGEIFGIGVYYSTNSTRTKSLNHCPFTGAGFKLEVFSISSSSKQQRLYPMSSGAAASGFYIRSRTTSGWASWYWIAGTSTSDVVYYTLLTSEPSDWSSAYYTKYYTWDDTSRVYEKIPQGSGAPEFATDTFYSRSTS